MAFARQTNHTTCCYDGPGDYHSFGEYDVYIVSTTGSLPATPKRVGHGYFPSWGTDSDQASKTLYYSYCGPSGRGNGTYQIKKVTVNSAGDISAESVHLNVPSSGGDVHMMCSPNGKYVAHHPGTTLKIWDSQKNTHHDLGGGYTCHPSWMADGNWLLYAQRAVCKYDGNSVVHKGNSGLGTYNFGSSQDMKWAICRAGDVSGNRQNTDGPVTYYPVTISGNSYSINTGAGTYVGQGTFCDIHVGDINIQPSIGLSAPGTTININESVVVTATMAGGLSGTVTWSVSGGGSLSNQSNSGATFTSDGTGGEYAITAAVGDVSSSITITVFDPSQIHYRINCGGSTEGSWESGTAYADGGSAFDFGSTVDRSGVTDAAPDRVYQTVRHGDHTYTFQVPDGLYTVRLHFNDMYGGDRKMNYTIEGEQVLTNFSPVDEAGGTNKACVKEFCVTVDDGDGLLIDAKTGSGNDVFQSAIEVIASSECGTVVLNHLANRLDKAFIGIALHSLPDGSIKLIVPYGTTDIQVWTPAGARVARLDRVAAGSYILNGLGASGVYVFKAMVNGKHVAEKIMIGK